MNTRLRRVVTVLSAVLLTAAGTAALSGSAAADPSVIYVDQAGGGIDGDGCGNGPAHACATIEQGIANADDGDTVHVAAASYPETVVIDKAITLQGAGATIAGSVSVSDVAGAVTVTGFTVSGAAPSLISVADSAPSADVTIADNTIAGNSASAQTGVAVAPTASVSITGNTFGLGSGAGGGGAAISLSAPNVADTLNVTTGGNTGTVAAPTRTIVESGNGTITVTPTATPNAITPAGAKLDVTLPGYVFTGRAPVEFGGTFNSGVELPHARYDITITGTPGITADKLDLEYQSGSDWVPFALGGTTSGGGAITGSFDPPAGADYAPGAVTTSFRLAVPDGTPNGSLSVVATLDEVAQPSGTPILNTPVSSAPGTVIIATNHPPVAQDHGPVAVPFNGSAAITLTATDADNDTLTYSIASGPADGSLSIVDGTKVTYTPNPGYSGPDSFTFTASDGKETSAAATVSLTVAANQAPVAHDQGPVAVPFNGTAAITLDATDADGDALTYSVATNPIHGQLTGTAPNLTYTPDLDYTGPDSFTFTASDGMETSAPATVSLTVAANHAPVAHDQSVSVGFEKPIEITLNATDADGDALTYAIASGPANGSLTTVNGTKVTYTPSSGYAGTDSFTFMASDGIATSAPATVSLTVAANHPPVASAKSYSVTVGGTVAITLNATDPDGDTVTLTPGIPDKGTLTGVSATLTYHAPANFTGAAHFTYSAKDTHNAVATATITIHIAKGKAVIGAVTFSPAHPTSAQVPKATVSVSASAGSVTAGTVTVTYGSIKRTAKVSGGKATVSLSKLTGGAHKLSIAFGGTSTSSSATATKSLTVSKVHTTLTVASIPKQLTTTSKGTLKVRVTATGASINGKTVTLKNGSRVMGTAKVVHRVAKIKLPKLALGQHNWSVYYPGSTTAAAVTQTVILRVALG